MAPARLAAAVLAVAASAGCMSVSDEGGRPEPSRSAAGQEAAAAEPDGGQARTGTGIDRTSGRAQKDRDGREKAKDGKAGDDPSASPGASPGASASPSKSGEAPPRGDGTRPKPRPGVPTPTQDTPTPTKPPQPPEPPPVTEPPPPEPSEPEPTPPPPSASPAADTQTAAMGQRREMVREPEASPQVGPV
ncbi:hypothetical protein [Streptomyces chryseus]|uniref:hypothetical protein n=1 Tax=Streptomyces chryseus TaxID=68186 RepID=UPI00110F99A1|nr:hypothetical protein [Streptomyces chryseus]